MLISHVLFKINVMDIKKNTECCLWAVMGSIAAKQVISIVFSMPLHTCCGFVSTRALGTEGSFIFTKTEYEFFSHRHVSGVFSEDPGVW